MEASTDSHSPAVNETLSLEPGAPLRLAIEALPCAALVVRADGTIALTNRQLERQFGYTRAELRGCPLEMLVPEARLEALFAHRQGFAAASASPTNGSDESLFGVRADGSQFPIEIGLSPVETDEGRWVLTSVGDISPRLEQDRRALAALDDRLEFERLVADLSVQFINLPSVQVDDAIREALGRLGGALDVDRCTFVRVLPDGDVVEPIGWQRPGVPPIPARIRAAERFPWALERTRGGQIICFSHVEEVPDPVDRASYRSLGTKSSVAVPLSVDGGMAGAVGIDTVHAEREWSAETLHRLRVVATVFANVLARRQADVALREALADVERLRDRLQKENVYLRAEARDQISAGVVVGRSPAVRRVLEQIQQVAVTDSTVLLLGETGTGKELFATLIHEQSARHGRAMVRVNCSAIPATLMESELFGRERGAFTGALARQIGRFELADRSTIFLDEIGDLPPEVQVKLLRVLEERQIERLGSPKSIRVDTRIIAATHRDLEARIAQGTFREDLFYRLNVFPIVVPPLRERTEDIPLLIWRFVEEFAKSFGKRIEAIPRENMAALQRYAWPGNIRELRNVVERAMIVATGTTLTIALPSPLPAAGKRGERLAEVEMEHIRSVLESVGWRIRGAGGAAERLGLKPTTLETRMAKLGLKRQKP